MVDSAPYLGYKGKILDNMPLLVRRERTPISVADLMDRVIQARNLDFSPEIAASLADLEKKDTPFIETGDAIFYHPDGKAKIVPDAQVFLNASLVNPQTRLSEGALVLPDGVYEGEESAEFAHSDLERMTSGPFTKAGAILNDFWRVLARSDERLDAYAELVFDEVGRVFGYQSNMTVSLGYPQNRPTARLVSFNWSNYRTMANGALHLNSDRGYLIGASKAAKRVQE